MFKFVKGFGSFMGARKKFWLLPLVIALGLVGGLLILSQSAVMAPFVYKVF